MKQNKQKTTDEKEKKKAQSKGGSLLKSQFVMKYFELLLKLKYFKVLQILRLQFEIFCIPTKATSIPLNRTKIVKIANRKLTRNSFQDTPLRFKCQPQMPR